MIPHRYVEAPQCGELSTVPGQALMAKILSRIEQQSHSQS